MFCSFRFPLDAGEGDEAATEVAAEFSEIVDKGAILSLRLE